MEIIEFLIYAVAFYFFWDMLKNPDGPGGRRAEPWVRKVRDVGG